MHFCVEFNIKVVIEKTHEWKKSGDHNLHGIESFEAI